MEKTKLEQEQDVEANYFASALLIPKSFLEHEMKGRQIDLCDDSEIKSLAKKFEVSQTMMMYRLTVLGYFK